MTYDDYQEFSALVTQRNIVFYYFGYFSQSITAAMAEAVRLQLEKSDAAPSTRRKIFSSFVEMAQNITHYSLDSLSPAEQRNDQLRQGSVCIGRDGDRYFLLCSNSVAADQVELLRQKVEPLKTMSLDDIKRAYRETLRAEAPVGSKGGGLGFLTLARDASSPLEFSFAPSAQSDAVTFFIKATI
ncbi:MAG: SiaB family protein kinase [Dokdonella sp.]